MNTMNKSLSRTQVMDTQNRTRNAMAMIHAVRYAQMAISGRNKTAGHPRCISGLAAEKTRAVDAGASISAMNRREETIFLYP